MSDVFTRSKRSAIMRSVRACDNSAELQVRRTLHAAGFRYGLHRADLPGRPDLVLRRYRLVVQVQGCFWHGHSCKRGARVPRTNREYWVAKISRNVARDARSQRDLEAQGWRCRIIWECELSSALEQLLAELRMERASRRPGAEGSPLATASPASDAR